MARTDTLGNFLTDVADAIREKKGTTDVIPANTFDTEIKSIEGGGSGEKYAPRFISFYKYNGTELDYELKNLDTSNITSMANMFYGCEKLANVDISSFDTSNVTTLVNSFRDCKALTSIDISKVNLSKVTNLDYAFYNCTKLETITGFEDIIFDGVVTSTGSCFYNCSNLVLTKLPDSLNTISTNCFYGCKKIAIPELPSSVRLIGSYAFQNSGQSVDMKLHDNITILNSAAFRNSMLKSIDIGTGITSIPSQCFRECYYTTKIIMRASKLTLSDNCMFSCNNLTYLVLPNITSVPTINNYTMGLGNTFPKLSEGGIYVPDNLVDSFKAEDSSWVTYGFGDFIKPISEYPEEL